MIKIDEDVPLSRACLLGCGVTTGWGSAVHTADVSPAFGNTLLAVVLLFHQKVKDSIFNFFRLLFLRNGFRLCVRAGFGAQNCQPALHLNRSTKLQVCTSPRLTQNPCYKPFFYFHVLDSPSPNSKYRLFAFITIKFCLVLVIAV